MGFHIELVGLERPRKLARRNRPYWGAIIEMYAPRERRAGQGGVGHGVIVAGARPQTYASGRGTGTPMLAGAAGLIWKRLNQILEPGLGILKYRLAIADQEDIEV